MEREDRRKTVHILARTLEAAKRIAKLNKNLNVSSGNWVNSAEIEEGGLKTYSFRMKDV
jgi:hypothetical protein